MMTRPAVRDLLELQLRRIPGVVGVGFSEEDGATVVHVLAVMAESMAELRRDIVRCARAFTDHTLVIDLQHLRSVAPAQERGRVKLVAVRVESFTQDLEVHLAHQGVHTVGRAVAGSPERAVDATMQALSDLGAELPFRVEAAAAPVVDPADEDQQTAVIVILEPEDDDARRGTRYGVAKGGSVEEAAARATLHALNRYLSRGVPLSSAS